MESEGRAYSLELRNDSSACRIVQGRKTTRKCRRGCRVHAFSASLLEYCSTCTIRVASTDLELSSKSAEALKIHPMVAKRWVTRNDRLQVLEVNFNNWIPLSTISKETWLFQNLTCSRACESLWQQWTSCCGQLCTYVRKKYQSGLKRNHVLGESGVFASDQNMHFLTSKLH